MFDNLKLGRADKRREVRRGRRRAPRFAQDERRCRRLTLPDTFGDAMRETGCQVPSSHGVAPNSTTRQIV